MEPIFAAQKQVISAMNLQKVRVVRNPNYQRHGTKSYVSLLNRFGFDPTRPGPYHHVAKTSGLESLKKVVGRHPREERVLVKKTGDAEHGEVTAEDQQNDSMYLCEVHIGTPPQKFMLDFDTGSADLWVCSTLQSKGAQGQHNLFDPTKSSTFKKLAGKEWKISYGDGSGASGACGSDTVVIGGLRIHGQTVEMAEKLSDQFVQSTGDGLVGLAFGSINTVRNKLGVPEPAVTPVENMMVQKDIPQESQLFTSAFYSERDGNPHSFYTFGFIDRDLVGNNEIHWTKVDNSQGFWQFPSTTYSINGQSYTQDANTAIADTGTTLALISDEACEALYKNIPGATYDEQNQGWVFPLSTTVEDIPDFRVDVGGKEFVIQAEDLAFAPADKENWYGGVQSRGNLEFDILGDTFLKSCYAIWDQGKKRFGVIPKIEKTQNLTPPAADGGGLGGGEKVTSLSMVSA